MLSYFQVIRIFYAKVLLERSGQLSPSNETASPEVSVLVDPSASPAPYNASDMGGNGTNKGSLSAVEDDEDPIIEVLWSITVAIFVLFGMFGAFMSGAMADKFGR